MSSIDEDSEAKMGSSSASVNDLDSSGSDKFQDRGRAEEDEPILARKETTQVKNLRYLLISVLLLVAMGTSVGLFFLTRSSEVNDFEISFEGQGIKLISGFQEDSQRKLQALSSLSSRLTAFSLDTNTTWPFVTVTHSDELFEPYRQLADAAAVQVMPIVSARQRAEWEDYAVDNQDWIQNDLVKRGILEQAQPDRNLQRITPYIKNYVGIDTSPGKWVVWWQYSPVIQDRYFVNFNRLAWDGFVYEAEAVERKKAVLSATWNFEPGLDFQSTQDFNFMDELLSAGGSGTYEPGEPIGYLHYPVFDTFDHDTKKTVAIVTATVYWRSYFQGILPDNVEGIHCVVENSLGQVFTYQVDGPEAFFLGMADFHDNKFDKYVIQASYHDFQDIEESGYTGVRLEDSYVSYSIKVYPSSGLENEYITERPYLYAALMFFVFLFTVIIFSIYDCMVERRQKLVMNTAARTNAVVKSLFPENVRGRLIEEAGMSIDKAHFLNRDETHEERSAKPIADFFPETTIMFADLVGFTAWSSVREPAQVFILLESVYSAFDEIAKKRAVFKVETVGDCYVAVAGLPQPRKDHAVVMSRFATDCLRKLHVVTTQLEVDLGPGTSDLAMRFGLHSGSVTAGVLRGDRSRFQLFGDTMNTASRMESTGLKDKIQVSEETADLLRQAGKSSWLIPREGSVSAKGKGQVKTFFVNVGPSTAASSRADEEKSSSINLGASSNMFHMEEEVRFDAHLERLVKWNKEVLCRILKQIVARRESNDLPIKAQVPLTFKKISKGGLDEVSEIISLPGYQRNPNNKNVNPDKIDLGKQIDDQVMDLVMVIARTYHKNPFHNFKHATSVTMSVSKLLSRIIAPTDIDYSCAKSQDDVAMMLHDFTFGITSDPLTQFACVFAALAHDADHPGVPNTQLIKEGAKEALAYDNRSIAEQNSLDLTWSLFMDGRYADLRGVICATQEEFDRFRQLVVNLILATDIMDKDMKQLRNDRWERAFSESPTDVQNVNRKATIVIEHLIQASDVAHTMQHWHIFRSWNECLFFEMCEAFDQGRATAHPAENWYQGELGFFDFYIIPLAKKLKDCGVFGVSSDEYLNYATKNRREWEQKGKQMVAEMLEKYDSMKGKPSAGTPKIDE